MLEEMKRLKSEQELRQEYEKQGEVEPEVEATAQVVKVDQNAEVEDNKEADQVAEGAPKETIQTAEEKSELKDDIAVVAAAATTTAADEQAAEKNVMQNLERFIQRIRMVAQQIIQSHNNKVTVKQALPPLTAPHENIDVDETELIEEVEVGEVEGEEPAFNGYTKIVNFDPDEDDFVFEITAAR